MLVVEDCDQDYDDIVPDKATFSEAVFAVINAADSGDWLEDFIKAVRKCAPRNRQLLRWIARYRPDAGNPPGMAPAAAMSLELMDSANFDLENVRQGIRDALKSASRVIGFTVTYPEAKFLEKLLNRLEYRLGAQSRTPLSLMLDDDLADSIAQVCSHRAVLDADVNVLVRVEVSGAEPVIIESFWTGVRDKLAASRGRLVLVFVGNRNTSFPPELITLPPPAFQRSDVENWTEDLVLQRKDWSANPAERANLGDSWAKWLCEKASLNGQPGNPLHSRLLYTHMDESLIYFRNAPEPGQFRVMMESWS
jgi:Effector-associated domain 1